MYTLIVTDISECFMKYSLGIVSFEFIFLFPRLPSSLLTPANFRSVNILLTTTSNEKRSKICSILLLIYIQSSTNNPVPETTPFFVYKAHKEDASDDRILLRHV